MRHEKWTVIEGDNRPAGPSDRCFYCEQPHGAQHSAGCVIRERTVVVRAIIEYVVSVPEDWDTSIIEFHREDSSWCASNGLGELTKLHERLEKSDACGCSLISYRYVREATEEDEAANAWPANPRNS